MITNSTTENSSLVDSQKSPVDAMDLSPNGLADAPANEQDHDSIVYPGNS